MRAIYTCPKCKAEVIINSTGTSPHFKRKACGKCNRPLRFKEIIKENIMPEDKNA
jgi:ribosomal protein S27AE